MSSGFHKLVVNTQEQAISTDLNRLQAFIEKDVAEIFRHLLDVKTSDLDLGSYVEPVTLETPLRGEIIRGLCVRPQVGGLALLVDPGAAFLIQPDPADSLEESRYKFVLDGGVPSIGALAMTPNSSGATRIDVIECRMNPIPATVTVSRNKFDSESGLFVPTTVTKETTGRLEFRVRTGVPGSGYPGNANGWLPLCVAHVPTGTTTNDSITFWDTRSLIEDRARGPMDVMTRPELLQFDARFRRASATSWIMNGTWRARHNGRLVGGVFRRGSPGVDADFVDFGESANRVTGLVEGAGVTLYGYMVFPFGLPRWSRYTDASSGSRKPREPKGIPIATAIAPDQEGRPSTPIPLDAIGFAGATTTDGLMCTYAFTAAAASNQFRECWYQNRVMNVSGSSVDSLSAASIVGFSAAFDVPANRVPANAKAIHLALREVKTVAAGSLMIISYDLVVPFDNDGTSAGVRIEGGIANYANPTGGGLSMVAQSPAIRVPMSPKFPGGAVATPVRINWETDLSPTAPTMTITGWEF